MGCQQHCGENLAWLVASRSLIQKSPIQERIQPHETRRFWNSLSSLLFVGLFIASPSLRFSVPQSSERCRVGFSSSPTYYATGERCCWLAWLTCKCAAAHITVAATEILAVPEGRSLCMQLGQNESSSYSPSLSQEMRSLWACSQFSWGVKFASESQCTPKPEPRCCVHCHCSVCCLHI